MERLRSMKVMRILFAVALLAGCGGEESVASKSAAAYREAQAKGVPIGGGHEHGGHASTATASTSDTDHSEHATPAHTGAHAGMDHGSTAAAGHSPDVHAAAGHATGSAAAAGGMADHAGHGGGQPERRDHAGMAHTAMGHEGHSTPAAASTAQHDQHPPAASPATQTDHSQHMAVAPGAAEPPDVRQFQPAAIPQTDAFDAPAAISVAEAKKAAMNVPDGDIRHIVPGQDQENPPTSQPAIFALPPGTVTPGSQIPGTQPPPPAPVDHSQHGAKP